MNLEDQVCALELAKRLKELGVKQDSYFYWVRKIFSNDPPVDPWIIQDCIDTHAFENISAFTVAELGELLPPGIESHVGFNGSPNNITWGCNNQNMHGYKTCEEGAKHSHIEYADTEADARAKMLIYLIENGLVKLYGFDK